MPLPELSGLPVSLNVVPLRLVPDRSPALNKVTWVLPSDPISTALRSARFWCARLSWMVRLPTVEVSCPLIVRGEASGVTAAAGIVTLTLEGGAWEISGRDT